MTLQPFAVRYHEQSTRHKQEQPDKQSKGFTLKNHHYFVYILLCSDKSYYVGMTNSLERRLWEHNEGVDPTCYTYTRRTTQLKYFEEYKYVHDAIAREKQLKGWSRRKKEALINGEYSKLPELSKSRSRHPSTVRRAHGSG